MTINLSAYGAVQTGLFVRIAVEEYKATPNATPTSTVLRFSDYNRAVTINSEVYTGLGRLMSVSSTTSELRASSALLSLALSGIPNSSIAEIVNSKIKGSPVQVYRVFFDANTGQQLNIAGNPMKRFQGLVNNYSLEEDFTPGGATTSNTILIECSSIVDVFSNKLSGRRTNPGDQKALYPTDPSMDRVLALTNSNFNFGSPVKG
jgi:hypothetical protein